MDAVYLRDKCILLVFQEPPDLYKNTDDFANKVWDQSETTWAVGIAQLTHHSVRGIFASTENLVVS